MDPERLSEPAWAGSDPNGVLVHELRHRANALKSPLSILDRRKEDYSIDAEIAFDQQRANRFRVEDSIPEISDRKATALQFTDLRIRRRGLPLRTELREI